MKVCMFHLMPYRDLPADFDQRYNSAYIDPIWFDVADSDKVGQYYNATLDEMLFAAKAGLHGLCTNQHHQNVYGFMANPSIMGAVLARETNGQNVAIIQLGSTLPSTTPPTRTGISRPTRVRPPARSTAWSRRFSPWGARSCSRRAAGGGAPSPPPRSKCPWPRLPTHRRSASA